MTVEWIKLTKDRIQWQACVNTFHSKRELFCQLSKLLTVQARLHISYWCYFYSLYRLSFA
jgi:hypothetical protein